MMILGAVGMAGQQHTLVFLLLLTCAACTAWACHESGLCSLGKVKPWSGDIDSKQAMQDALAARGYKNEIVLSIFGGVWFETLLQLWSSMNRMGMAHLLALTVPDGRGCKDLMAVEPGLGCAWSGMVSGYHPDVPLYQMWVLRHMLAARMVRAGWNVMVIDADIIFLTDPYTYLKRPPFSSYPLVVHREARFQLNCGAYYAQGAKPDGPVAYFLAEVAYRPLRYKDDEYAWITSQGINWGCEVWEQELFNSVMSAMLLGGPVFGLHAFNNCHSKRQAPETEAQVKVIEALQQERIAQGGAVDVDIPMPADAWPAWHRAYKRSNFTAEVVSLRLPRYDWGGPADFPGRSAHPPLPRGPLGSYFMTSMAESGAAPMWPDPELPRTAAELTPQEKAQLEVTEKMLIAPQFLMGGWYLGARRGRWTNSTSPSPSLLAHYARAVAARMAGAGEGSKPGAEGPAVGAAEVAAASLGLGLAMGIAGAPSQGPSSTSSNTSPGSPFTGGLGLRRVRQPPAFHSLGYGVDINLSALLAMQRTGHAALKLSGGLGAPGVEAGANGGRGGGGNTAAASGAARANARHLALRQGPPRAARHMAYLDSGWAEDGYEKRGSGREEEAVIGVQDEITSGRQLEHPQLGQDQQEQLGGQSRQASRELQDQGQQQQQQQQQQQAEGQDFRPAAALAHFTAIPFTPSITKLILLRYISQFDWEIHIRARNKTSGLLYYSSTQERLTPKLVAYHPSVPLHLAHNLTAFQVLLRGLAQVATLANRTVLWPDIPCAAQWISPMGPAHLLKVPYDNQMDPHTQPYGPLGMQRCFNQRYSQDTCLFKGRGMVEAEFSHLRAHHPRRQQLHPSPLNTIRIVPREGGPAGSGRGGGLSSTSSQVESGSGQAGVAGSGGSAGCGQAGSAAGASGDGGSGSRSERDIMCDVLEVSQQEVAKEVQGLDALPILYIAHPVAVAMQAGSPQAQAYEEMQRTCAALGAGWDHFEGPHSFVFRQGQMVGPPSRGRSA